MNFSQGHSRTKVQCESCFFPKEKTPEFTKMGEIHELFVLALSLVCFAGATPDLGTRDTQTPKRASKEVLRRPVRGFPCTGCTETFFHATQIGSAQIGLAIGS